MSLAKISPKVSIVMPMYQVEKFIGKAIKSVLDQDFQDWELLIVNDGSLDDSRSIALQVSAGDQRVKIFDKDNGGLSDARNFGLIQSCGEYVHFFDSDDWIEPDFYSTLLKNIEHNDLIVCGLKVDNGISINERNSYTGNLYDADRNSLSDLVSGYLNFAWNKLFRRSFLVEHNLFYEKGLYRIEDSEFMLRFLKCKPTVKMHSYAGYHYRVGNMSTLSNVYDSKVFEHAVRSLSIYSQIFQILTDDSILIRNELGNMAVSVIKSTLYKLLRHVPLYKVVESKRLVDQILDNDAICHYVDNFTPIRRYDKLLVKAVQYRLWWVLLIAAQFKK